MKKVDADQARASAPAAFDFLGSDERVKATKRAC